MAGVAGAAAGIVALWLLLRSATRRAVPASAAILDPAGGGVADRGRFLGVAAAAVLVTAAGVFGGSVLVAGKRIDEIRQAIRIPRPARRAPAPPAGADLGIRGLSPLYVPNADFYRIDTASPNLP